MMARVVCLCGLLLPLLTWSGLALAASSESTGIPLILGHRFALQSAALGEERGYQVHRPPGYDISTSRYPVLYVTDGNEHFQQVSATVDFLAAAGEIPEMIVVGIPNTNRFRDLLGYTRAAGDSPLLKFITEELAPRIEADYRTLPYRMLMGWSDGGLFALHALMNAPDAFRSYLVLALATGDDQTMSERLASFLQSRPESNLNADIYMAMDNVSGRALAWAYETASVLQQRAGRVRDLRFKFQYYADESHLALPMRGVQDGLRAVFEGWRLTEPFTVYEQGGSTAIEKHFATLSGRLGFPVSVSQEALFSTFTSLEARRRYPEALQVISRAVELQPASTTALYYLARVQNRMGNRPQSVETLKTLLKMSPGSGAALTLLQEMQVDPGSLVSPSNVSLKDFAKYVGRYGNPVVFVIEQRGGKLFGLTSYREYTLVPLSTTKFSLSENNVYGSGGSIEFRIGARGQVNALSFGNEGPELLKLK